MSSSKPAGDWSFVAVGVVEFEVEVKVGDRGDVELDLVEFGFRGEGVVVAELISPFEGLVPSPNSRSRSATSAALPLLCSRTPSGITILGGINPLLSSCAERSEIVRIFNEARANELKNMMVLLVK